MLLGRDVSGVNNFSLWGTFSVADHLRRRPFVADVLLYDLLIVPVPDGQAESVRWQVRRRNPQLQRELLEIIGDLAMPIPWSFQRHGRWAQTYSGIAAPDAEKAVVRNEVAKAVAFDANNIAAAKAAAAQAGTLDPDDPVFLATRMILAEEFGSFKEKALLARIPLASEVEAVVAYGSYRNFSDERGDVTSAVVPGGQPVFTFSWPFFVPSSSDRSDQDLLREAVELAHTDEIATWRSAVQRWRRNAILFGRSDDEALADMEAMIADYQRAARRLKIEVSSRWGLCVAGAAAAATAVFVPPVGIAAAVLGLGSLIPSHKIPQSLEAAAIFHEARRRFS